MNRYFLIIVGHVILLENCSTINHNVVIKTGLIYFLSICLFTTFTTFLGIKIIQNKTFPNVFQEIQKIVKQNKKAWKHRTLLPTSTCHQHRTIVAVPFRSLHTHTTDTHVDSQISLQKSFVRIQGT